MQPVALIAQALACLQSDLEVRCDRFFVEFVGLAGQFYLAMQRLVRDTQKRSIRHTETVPLCRDGRAFHFDCNRAALRETLG